MQITSLEIVLAVAAVFVVFGPKGLPKRKRERAIKMEKERIPVRPTGYIHQQAAPHTYAAGRAPSPLQLRDAERPLPALGQKPQFAHGDKGASPLPHEMLRV